MCPAGEVVGDGTCHCRIEQVLIDGHLNPSTIENYCMGGSMRDGYHECPTWRADKELTWKTGRGVELKKETPRGPGFTSPPRVTHTERAVGE